MDAATNSHARVVVGYDGSEGAERALSWAVQEAVSRNAPLRVVQAWSPGEYGTWEEQGMQAESRLNDAMEVALKDLEEVPWDTVTRKGSAGKILTEESAGAQLLVVGSRGHGTAVGKLLGSVGQYVCTHHGADAVVIVKNGAVIPG